MDTNKIREALEQARAVGVEMEWDGLKDRCEQALAELDKAQQPAAGLTVDEVMEAIEDDIGSEGTMRLFRARLAAALAAKTRE